MDLLKNGFFMRGEYGISFFMSRQAWIRLKEEQIFSSFRTVKKRSSVADDLSDFTGLIPLQ